MARQCHQCHCVGTDWLHDHAFHSVPASLKFAIFDNYLQWWSPYTLTFAEAISSLHSLLIPLPSPKTAQPPPLPSPTTTEIHQPILTKDPIYIQPHSKWVEVHWSLIRLEQYFHFPLFYAQKRRKKNSYKNSCHSCVHATTEAVLNTEPR